MSRFAESLPARNRSKVGRTPSSVRDPLVALSLMRGIRSPLLWKAIGQTAPLQGSERF